MQRALRALLISLALVVGLVVMPGTASAGPTRNGICEPGEVCFYFNSNQGGVLSDLNYPLANYGTGSSCNHFLKPNGTSSGICLKNNAASIWNRTKQIAWVFYNSGYKGFYQTFQPGVKENFNSTLKNENASHTFKNVPTPQDVAPVFGHKEDGPGGIHHHAWVTFKASDLHNGKHVRSVWVTLEKYGCKHWPDDDALRYSVDASSSSDTTTIKVETDIWDSPLKGCTVRSHWDVNEYF